MSQRDVIFHCRIVGAELRGTNSDMKIGGGLRRNRGGVQRGGVRPPASKAVVGRVSYLFRPYYFGTWFRRKGTGGVELKSLLDRTNEYNDIV